MIVIPVMDSELVQVFACKLAIAAAAYPWVELQSLLPIAQLPLRAVLLSFRDDTVQLFGIGFSLLASHRQIPGVFKISVGNHPVDIFD